MEEANKTRISVIMEDQKLQDYVTLILMGEDYQVYTYSAQDIALANLERDQPDLIISDFETSNINGIEICKLVRKKPLFAQTPIIFILQDTDPLNKAKLIYAGGDDYILTSSLEEELLNKIKLSFYRKAREKDINPLTKLAGQFSLWKELQKRIEAKNVFSVCYSDLYRLRDFNQRYGFKKGDEIIKFVSSLIQRTLKELGSPTDVLFHPQNDDFIYLTMHDGAEAAVNKIIESFDLTISTFYEPEDRTRGHLLIKNRKGEIQKVPFLRIYTGIVTNENYQFINPAQVIQVAAELKDFSREISEKSSYAKERRKTYPFY